MQAQTWTAYQRFPLEDEKDKITLSYDPKTRNSNKLKGDFFFSVLKGIVGRKMNL